MWTLLQFVGATFKKVFFSPTPTTTKPQRRGKASGGGGLHMCYKRDWEFFNRLYLVTDYFIFVIVEISVQVGQPTIMQLISAHQYYV